MRGSGRVAGIVLGLAVSAVAAMARGEVVASAEADDSYIRGYVTAVAEREFSLPATKIEVEGGVVRIDGIALSASDRAKLAETISKVKGVKSVRIVTKQPTTVPLRGAEVVEAAKKAASEAVAVASAPVKMVSGDDRELGLLPSGHLFEPLMANPRWPDFSATYQYYSGSNDLESVGATSFGGTLPIYRFSTPGGGASEFGLQAGVFAIFDLNGDSHDLTNADYFVAITESYRLGDFSLMARLWHQSSHLGDEFLLKHPEIDRVNLSYEQVDVLFSYDLNRSWRVYGGPGYLFDQDPEDLEPWSIEYGLEWQSAKTFASGRLRPVAGVDFQHHEREDWTMDMSLRAGVQLEGPEVHGNKLQLLFEYYTGRSPNGQFYDRNVQWYGLGLHWFF